MAKIVQIVATAETNRARVHLFALDEEGNVFLKTFHGDEEFSWETIDSIETELAEEEK